MADVYLWRKGERELGPFPLSDLRRMIRTGAVGRFHQISKDEGNTWAHASTFPELWESTELVSVTPAVDPATPPVGLSIPTSPVPEQPPATSTPQATTTVTTITRTVMTDPSPPTPVTPGLRGDRRGFGLGLSGFITATSALVLGLGPLLFWAFRSESGYWAVPLAAPLLASSITGMVLSGVGMSRRPGGFATSGLVVGICGTLLGLVTSIGWLVSHDPREDWIRRLTATAEADLQLARKNFASSLKRYREHSPDDEHAEALAQVTKDMMIVAQAHKRLLVAAATTPRFEGHFAKLDDLRTSYVGFTEAVKLQDNLTPQEAIDRIGEDSTTLKEVLDLHDLYQTRQLSAEAAKAKFRSL